MELLQILTKMYANIYLDNIRAIRNNYLMQSTEFINHLLKQELRFTDYSYVQVVDQDAGTATYIGFSDPRVKGLFAKTIKIESYIIDGANTTVSFYHNNVLLKNKLICFTPVINY